MSLGTFAEEPRAPLNPIQQLLHSLLLHWPHPPHVSMPSVLLCGPSGSGKSHLIHSLRSVPHHRVGGAACMEGGREEVATTPSWVTVAVPISSALTVRTKDGSTGLRRLLRRAIADACNATQMEGATAGGNVGAQADALLSSHSPGRSALVLLDHVHFFFTAEGDTIQESSVAVDIDDSRCQPSTRHPALVADIYTILRCAPSLFTDNECQALGLQRLVVVALFGGGFANRVHPFLRDKVFNWTLNIATPTQMKRQAFFTAHLSAPPHEGGLIDTATRQALADAIALRTGGMTYTALLAIAEQARLVPAPAGGEASQEVVSAAAQRLVRAFVTSTAIAAMDYRRSAGYVDVQSTRWSDIAGMEGVKQTLQELVTRPLQHRALYHRTGIRPSTGVLLHGPPGTGKTMLAKAMATELNAAFVYVDLPGLVQAEVGESERRLDEFFALARERSPTVMFIDELQAAFGVRYQEARPGSAAGLHSTHDARLVTHLLQLLDGAQADADHLIVFVGATNVVSLLDPLVLRPGRLDTHIAVLLPDADARERLVRHVVEGAWAPWLSAPLGGDGKTGAVLKARLVAEFVGRSAGRSGAELRHAMAVFALHVMQAVEQMEPRQERFYEGDLMQRALLNEKATQSGVAETVLSDLALRALKTAFQR